jgi:hypothetical protein
MSEPESHDYTTTTIKIPLEVFEFFSRASGGNEHAEQAITNALRTLMEMFSV